MTVHVHHKDEKLRRLEREADSPYDSPAREKARQDFLKLRDTLRLPRLKESYSAEEAAHALEALIPQLHGHGLGPSQTIEGWAQRVRMDGFWPIIVSTADGWARNMSHNPKNRALYRRAYTIMIRVRDGHTVRQHVHAVAVWRARNRRLMSDPTTMGTATYTVLGDPTPPRKWPHRAVGSAKRHPKFQIGDMVRFADGADLHDRHFSHAQADRLYLGPVTKIDKEGATVRYVVAHGLGGRKVFSGYELARW